VEDIKQRYREALVKHIDALESARADLLAGDPGAADTIRQIVHQLKGSGGTYGYQEITAAAEALQNAQEKEIPARLDALLVILRKVAFEAVD
jgi:HPt (histidine-containing phosphotransfer) domain-containing protein